MMSVSRRSPATVAAHAFNTYLHTLAADMAELADPGRRAALFAHLLAETRPHALFAYVAERAGGRTAAMLLVELVSADGRWAADYPIRAGRGWHRRELQRAPHRRV